MNGLTSRRCPALRSAGLSLAAGASPLRSGGLGFAGCLVAFFLRPAISRGAYSGLVAAGARDGVLGIRRRQDLAKVRVLLVAEHRGSLAHQLRALHERAIATRVHE